MTVTRFPRCATEPQKSGIIRAAADTILENSEYTPHCWDILIASEDFKKSLMFIVGNMQSVDSVNDKPINGVLDMAVHLNKLLKSAESEVLKSFGGSQ